MYKLWLIQRGEFKDTKIEDVTGMDSIISWLYMGSAEFEFGGLPESLHRVVESYKEYSFVELKNIKDNNGDTLRIYCKTEEKDDAVFAARQLSKNDYGYKEFAGLNSYIQNKTDTWRTGNFWWDIENDFFVMFGDDKQELVSIALDKLKEKWVAEEPTKKSVFKKLFNK